MIERAINNRDLKSVFYQHNLRLAVKWEEFCENQNGEISGIVNSHIIEFELVLGIKNLNIQVNGIRQRSNVNVGYSIGFSFVKNTIIIVSKVYYGRAEWKIYRINKFRNLLNKIIGKRVSRYGNTGYSIASRSDIEITKNSIELQELFEIAEIRTISYSNETIRIEYFTLIGIQSLQKLISKLNG